MNQQNSGGWTEEKVIGLLRDLAKKEELPQHLLSGSISSEDTVDTLGIDSIGAVTLIDTLEEEVGQPLPDDFLDLTDNIAGIVKRLNDLS